MQSAPTTTPVILPDFGTYITGQGGYFSAILRGPTVDGVQQPPLALITADSAHHIETTWGVYGKRIAGCASHADGHTNTLAMLAEDCPAAKHARGLTIDGHSDFFLPAIGQLNAIKTNTPELVDPEAIVWSSTQDSSNHAFAQNFEHGYSHWYAKYNEFLVVPVRVIQLHHLNTSPL